MLAVWRSLRIGSYQLGDAIGKGGFGHVFKALNVESGKFVAIKQINLQQLKEDQVSAWSGRGWHRGVSWHDRIPLGVLLQWTSAAEPCASRCRLLVDV